VETDLIHTFGPYDFEVDTTNADPSAVAASVLAAWRAGTRRRALWHGISGNPGNLIPYLSPPALVAADEDAVRSGTVVVVRTANKGPSQRNRG
jgi:hypothetical protein